MKKLLTASILGLICLFAGNALDGTWIFSNMYSQNIHNGKATLQILKAEIIKQAVFSNEIVNASLGSKKAKVSILTPENDYRTYAAEYKDSPSLIVFWIRREKDEINLWLFIAPIDNYTYWYSMAISSDAASNGRVLGTKDSDSAFMNILGSMTKQ